MKLSLKIMIVGMVVAFMSCSPMDHKVYNGNYDSNQTLLTLDKASYSITVDENGEGSATIVLQSSTHTDADRTFDIELVSDDIDNNAVVYTYDHTVTIPAGKYLGSFDVNVTSSNLQGHNYSINLGVVKPQSDNYVLENGVAKISVSPQP